MKRSMAIASFCLTLLACTATSVAQAGATLDRVKASGTLKVCIWPQYFSITYRNPRKDELSGIDIDLSAELARDLGVKVNYVDSSFATLISDVRGDRCDIAMFAVAVLPQRVEHLSFTKPYLASDIYAVTTKSSAAVKSWADIDKPGVLVGVQAGTFMEPIMAAELKQAKLVSVKAPDTRERELEAGRIDVFMTDFPYSRKLVDTADWVRVIAPPKPLHVTPYAYAAKPGDDAWLAALDEFVARIKRDGRLRTAAAKHGLAEIVAR